jgi:TetR/AcrR family transcriptional regulator, mexJK operon transcriptional repressor
MTSTSSTPDLDSQKAQQIIGGARLAFLELGFEGASVGEIARRAGVSKGTLYNYFPDKAQLFDAIVRRETTHFAQEILDPWEPALDVATSVREAAVGLPRFFCSESAQALYRLCIAEAQRFPHVGRALYEHGPDVCSRRLAEYLAVARSRGELDVDDTELAAHQLASLCRARLFERVLLGMQTDASEEEIARVADSAASVFLRAYGTRD